MPQPEGRVICAEINAGGFGCSPVATLELKTVFTQTVAEAVTRCKTSWRPKDPGAGAAHPLFVSGARALAHFAVSDDEVMMTTKLAGAATHFLPFNRGGPGGGAGDPPNPGGLDTAHLWERVSQRDAWLNILGRLMCVKA